MIPRHSADGCAGVWVSVGVAVVGGVAVAVVVGAGVGAAVTAGVGVWVGVESYFRQTLLYADLLPCVLAVAVPRRSSASIRLSRTQGCPRR